MCLPNVSLPGFSVDPRGPSWGLGPLWLKLGQSKEPTGAVVQWWSTAASRRRRLHAQLTAAPISVAPGKAQRAFQVKGNQKCAHNPCNPCKSHTVVHTFRPPNRNISGPVISYSELSICPGMRLSLRLPVCLSPVCPFAGR